MRFHDQYVVRFNDEGWSMEPVTYMMAEVKARDAIMIVTNRKKYDYMAILEVVTLVVETQNALGDP